MLNAFTVDVEDYFQVTAFEGVISRHQWDAQESRVVGNTKRLLDLLAEQNVTGTFFVLGWVADRFPKLVAAIREAGHELGCHSFWHRLIYQQTAAEFRQDLRRAKCAIEDAAGEPIEAYRAPSFSITRQSLWALEVLVEEGFKIDSSIFPTRHDRYGIANAETQIHQIETSAGQIWEFPMAVHRLGWWNLPISGGGYFRLYPFGLTRHCLAKANDRGQPFSFYIHPWELDAAQPRIAEAPRLARWRHRVNLASTEQKLKRLLSLFRFGTMSQVLNEHQTSFGGQLQANVVTAVVDA